MHFKIAILSFPSLRHVSIANSISSFSAIPVDIIIGLFLPATYLINGISVISKDAILYAGTSISSKKSTEVLSKGEEKTDSCNKDSSSIKDDILSAIKDSIKPLVADAVKEVLGIKENDKAEVKGCVVDNAVHGNETRDYSSFL